MKEVKFSELCHPTSKQDEAFVAVNAYKYVLYGGAMGGGKSFFIRWCLLKLLREYYQAGLTADENAKAIKELSGDEEYRYSVADPSIFAKTGLPESIADVLRRNGIDCYPGSNDRIAGWNFVRQYLRTEKLKIFTTCVNTIRTIPEMLHDSYKPEDLDTKLDDHAADCARYFLQTLRARKTKEPLTGANPPTTGGTIYLTENSTCEHN